MPNVATPSIPAIITAGGRIDGRFAAEAGTSVKAFVPFGAADTFLDRVRAALEASGRVRSITIVGPADALASFAEGRQNVRIVPEGATGPENIARAFAALPADERDGRVLLCTCDLPLLDGESVRWLVDGAPETADIVFPVLTRPEYDAALPGSPNTYVRLDGDEYTGGSVFVVRPAAIERNRPLIEQVFAARKSQIAMARLLGLRFVFRFITGRLTLAMAEARASALTGCDCRALPHAPAALAADVDTEEDYAFVRAVLGAADAAGKKATAP